MIIGNREFKDYTFVMAIINVTPDSFWHGSRHDADDVLFAVEKAVKDGAAVIDIGAQSTRPGYTEVSAEQEISRFARPLMLIKERFEIPVSVDTYYSESAKTALSMGADMINDVWGLTYDGNMAKTVAAYGAAACIMHNSKTPLSGDIWRPIDEFLKDGVRLALEAGIDENKIILDGGIGFAKNREQNSELLNGYERLSSLGYPLLLGASRKSLFGGNVENRLPQTVEATRLAARKGVLFVRVHDVKENADAIAEEYDKMRSGKVWIR